MRSSPRVRSRKPRKPDKLRRPNKNRRKNLVNLRLRTMKRRKQKTRAVMQRVKITMVPQRKTKRMRLSPFLLQAWLPMLRTQLPDHLSTRALAQSS